MTFVEAAIEVLKREGKPLPVKRLAELAVKNNLLSVVGRDPEGTMQLRLADAVETQRTDLLEVRPGLYGLRVYPVPSVKEPAAAPAKEAAAAPGSADEEERGGKRRRRGRRGRGKGKAEAGANGAAPAAAEPAEEEEKPAEAETETVEAKAPVEKTAAVEEADEKGEAKEGGKRRRRRGGRGRRRPEGAAESEAAVEAPVEKEEETTEAPAVEAAPAPAAEPAPAPAAAAEGEPEEMGEGELLEDDEIDLPSGPLLAPTHGADEMTRTDEDRVVRAEIHGRREERGRHRRERGGRDRHKGTQSQAQSQTTHPQTQPSQPSQQQQMPSQPQQQTPSQSGAPPARRSLLDAVLELLRQSDGRPTHARHLTDQIVNKKLFPGQPNELYRQVRAALVREVRERESEGLRARVRSLGGGQFALVDRKLDPDLAQAERELGASAARQREATRSALRRRLSRMAPPAFEALGRVLCDKLGVAGVELVRRGEGVAYFGGVRQLGSGALKTLVALRPGEAEIGRRAVGELRAGLAARGYDEGLLLASGRLGPDGAAELKSGSGVVLHDGLSLATLLIKHGLGVRRLHLPVDYLDLEFLGELTEG